MLRRVAQELGGRAGHHQLHRSGGAAAAAAGDMGWRTKTTTTTTWSSHVVAGWISHHNHFSTTGVASSSGNSIDNRPTDFVELKDTFTERRRLWKAELNAMRKVWAAEHAQKLAEKAARDAEKRRIIELEMAERRRLKAIIKAKKAIVHNAKVAKELKERKEDAVIRAQRRAQREFVEHLRRTAREEELLNASRNWVTREDLDVQIEYALNNPVMMW